jgi:bacterioferritin-associated ferredoxin
MPDPDEELCFCYHLTRAKLLRFLAQRRPERFEEIGEHLGAGTSCGFCRGRLKTVFAEFQRESGAGPKD